MTGTQPPLRYYAEQGLFYVNQICKESRPGRGPGGSLYGESVNEVYQPKFSAKRMRIIAA